MVRVFRKKVAENLVYSIVYQLLMIILPLITTPYISRVLGAEKIGIYSYSNSIASYFVLFACLGISNYGNRSIARVKHLSGELDHTFSSIYCFQLIVSSSITVLYIIYSTLISKDKLAAIFAGLYVLSTIVDLNWVLNGLEEFKYLTIRSAAVKIFAVVLIFTLVKGGDDVYHYITICCGTFLVNNLFALPLIQKKGIQFVKCKLTDVLSHWKPMIALFIPLMGMSVYKYFNKILLNNYSSLIETGLFESAEKVLLVPISFVIALGNVMLPRMSALFAQKDGSGIQRYMEYSFYFAVIAASSMGFGIIAIINEFVPLFYGVGFEKCIFIIPILMISPVFLAIANVIRTQYLIPKGNDREYVISILFGAVVDLVIAFLLIPKLASIGAAIAVSATEFAVCIMQVFLSRREKYIIKSILKSAPFVFFAIIMCIAVRALPSINNPLINITYKIIVGAMVISVLDGGYLVFMKKRNNTI